jgi:hypothetical protein
MANSIRFIPNTSSSAGTIDLRIEGITQVDALVDKNILIEVYEIDYKQDGGISGKSNDLLATFTAVIRKGSNNTAPVFFFNSVVRTDSNPSVLPIDPPRSVSNADSSKKWTLPFTPKWQYPHFNIRFVTSPSGTNVSSPFLILFQSQAVEREKYIYEIGVTIKQDKKIFFDSTRSPAFIDCNVALANNCAEATRLYMQDHIDLIGLRTIGTNYGSEYVPSNQAIFQTEKTTYKLQQTSCIDYVLSAFELGHQKTFASKDWSFIKSFLSEGKGTTLAKGLEKNGWIGLYYNPDVKNPYDMTAGATKSEHSYSYVVAKKSRIYYDLRVRDLVINYRPTTTFQDGRTPKTVTPKESAKVDLLKKVTFGFVIAKGGMHTALLHSGNVYEVHWDQGPREISVYQASDFQSLWPWLSGMIYVPKGAW